MNLLSMHAKTKTTKLTLVKRATSGVVVALVMALYPAFSASADNFDDQIRALQDQVSGFQTQQAQLHAQADNLQNQLAALDAQQAALQAQISANILKKQQLDDQIQQTSERIANQRDALARTLKAVYLESSISQLEMVASSKSIGDFIDKQEYRNKIRDTIQQNLKTIKDLQAQLTQQKKDVEHVLADQNALQAQLAQQQTDKNNLLAQTQGQETAYQQLTTEKNSKINDLRAQQRAANARFIGKAGSGPACGGGYPGIACNAPMDSVVDNWLMYNRECVS